MTLPTFIGIGPGRAATTTLYEALKEHPDVCMAKDTKETNFFNLEYHRGVRWYQSFFDHCRDGMAIGEISNLYIYDPQVPSRIAGLLPDVRLITVLRNPYDRIRSVYLYRRRAGEIDLNLGFAEAIEAHPSILNNNNYGDQLTGYLKHFPRENLLIAFFDDLESDPGSFIERVFAFIGVESSFDSQAVFKRFNPAVDARAPLLARLVRYASGTLRKIQLYRLLERAKGSPFLRSLLFKSVDGDSKEMGYSEQVERLLVDHFTPQIEKVEQLTGRSLEHWHPDRVRYER
jgi:hypothetical protein